jgi:putative lipase involved disintegration of autophagic bodies
LCQQRKIKEKDYRRRIFYGPRRRSKKKLCATIWRNSGAAKLLLWCTNASMGSGAAISPPNFAVPNVAFEEPYAHLPQSQQNVAIIGGYATRNMQIIAAIQTNANQMGEGNANIAYEL